MLDWIEDKRTRCWSVQTSMSINEYLRLASAAHDAKGEIEGQRGVLTTTTAKRIRSRMVSDIVAGAVLPPVVVGVVIDTPDFDQLPLSEATSITEVLSVDQLNSLSIIDGMQRTGAMREAMRESESVGERTVRVEFWITDLVRALIYRMLVLNTGQVPWTIARQLAVVYGPLIDDIKRNVPELDKVSSPDNPGRRVAAAQYSTSDLVELYIAFSSRKAAVDSRESVSDEFTRIDFVDNLASQSFQDYFYSILSFMAQIDIEFSRFDGTQELIEQGAPKNIRFGKGRDVFGAQPARTGFIVSLGIAVLGRPGAERTEEDRVRRMLRLEADLRKFVSRLKGMSPGELEQFLKLDILREALDKKVGQVGRFERQVFSEAFKVLVEERFEISNMEPCWRAGV